MNRHDGHEEETEGWIHTETAMCVHGALMVIGWVFCINLGNAVARYLRNAPFPFDGWFKTHIVLQVCGFIMTLTSFIIIMVHVGLGDDSHFAGLHQFVGLLVMLGVFLQIPLGVVAHFRWTPGHTSALDKWHWWIGRGLYWLGLVNVLTGFSTLAQEGAAPNAFLWFLVGFMFCVVFFMVAGFEIHIFDPHAADYYRLKPSHDVSLHSLDDPHDTDDSLFDSPSDSSASRSNKPYYWWFISYTSLLFLAVLAVCIGIFTCLEKSDPMP